MNLGTLIRNEIVSRTLWFKELLGRQRRDVDEESGHPYTVTIEDCKRKFLRGDIASRVNKIYPEECWSQHPEIYETEEDRETEFEKSWDALQTKFRLYSLLQRADILSGIGRFGVILLGIGDGGKLNEPVVGIDETGQLVGERSAGLKLLYLRPFDETFVKIKSVQADEQNPRYGLPVMYEIRFTADQVLSQGVSVVSGPTETTTTKEVHWTRVIHICDNRTNNDVYGLPRMEVVFDRILGLHKIASGSPEMFWKGGFPGIAVETQGGPNGEPVQLDKETTKEELMSYFEGLQRYLALEGATAKSLAVEIEDPGPHAELQIRLICITLSVPWRIFMGAEVGALASGQDIIAWNRRLNRRREEYLTPFVIRPFIDRLIAFGVLPMPKGNKNELVVADPEQPQYTISWMDLNTPSEEDKATVADKKTSAMSKYVAGGCDQLIPPFHYLTLILGLDDEKATAILDELGDRVIETDPEAEHQQSLDKIAAKGAAALPPDRGVVPAGRFQNNEMEV